MVSPPTSPWEAFNIARVRHAKLVEATEQLANSCRKLCGKPHLTKCSPCHLKLLGLMRERYVTNYDPRDWFAGRSEFIAEIDNMLSSAAIGKTDVQSIDARIMAEKKIWQQFAFPPRDRKLGDQVEKERAKLKGKTDEELDEVARMVVEDSSSNKADAYANMFFSEYPSYAKKKYVGMLKEGRTMAEVCEAITEDDVKRSKVAAQVATKRAQLEAELAKFQRAKAASDLEQKKKKGAAQKTMAETIKLPPCACCGVSVDVEKYVSCTYCYIYAEAGAIKERTVYCSPICQQKHTITHLTEHHLCSADTKCVQALEVSTGPDAGPQQSRGEEPVICLECLREYHRPTLFCGARCAKASFQVHRDTVHIPNRKPEDRTRDDHEVDKINFTTYTAKNIWDHVVPLGKAYKEAKERDKNLKTWGLPERQQQQQQEPQEQQPE